MSLMAVLLYAGVTTLTAAIVTLFTAAMAAGNMERRARSQRHYRPLEATVTRRQPEASRTNRPLEGSRTDHRSLSSLGSMVEGPEPPATARAPVQAEAAQGLPATASQPAVSAAAASAAAAFAVQGTPPPARERKADTQEALPPRHRSLVPGAAKARPAAPQPSPAPDDAPQPAASDAIADLEKLLEELQMPAGDFTGSAAPEDGGGTLDILAGMDEPEMAMVGLDNELAQIDGGGLPAPARKSPSRPRR